VVQLLGKLAQLFPDLPILYLMVWHQTNGKEASQSAANFIYTLILLSVLSARPAQHELVCHLASRQLWHSLKPISWDLGAVWRSSEETRLLSKMKPCQALDCKQILLPDNLGADRMTPFLEIPVLPPICRCYCLTWFRAAFLSLQNQFWNQVPHRQHIVQLRW